MPPEQPGEDWWWMGAAYSLVKEFPVLVDSDLARETGLAAGMLSQAAAWAQVWARPTKAGNTVAR